MSMSTSLPKYKKKASRFEYCCIRGLYACPLLLVGGFVMGFIRILLMILAFFNFFTILLAGKRGEGYYDWTLKVNKWTAHVMMYLAGATDERPSLTAC